MTNAESTETREFGMGLRAYLQHRGVRLDARAVPRSNLDLFALAAVEPQQAEPAGLTLQTGEPHGVSLLAA